jgi:hypothetical protein
MKWVLPKRNRTRNAWTPIGEVHAIEAKRSKRLNVVGAWLSSGKLFAVKLWEHFGQRFGSYGQPAQTLSGLSENTRTNAVFPAAL